MNSKIVSIVAILLITICTFSCGIKEKKEKEKKEKKLDSIESAIITKNKDCITALELKYRPIIFWDTSIFFTYKLQDMIVGNRIGIYGEILDITKVDTNYFLKLEYSERPYSDFYNHKTFIEYANIYFEKINLIRLETILNSYENSRRGYFIIKVNNVDSVTIKGDLINFYIMEEFDRWAGYE